MNLEDNFELEIGIAGVVIGMLSTPHAWRLMRRGAVYGVAGVLLASDTFGALIHRARRESQPPTASSVKQELAEEAHQIKAKQAEAGAVHEQ